MEVVEFIKQHIHYILVLGYFVYLMVIFRSKELRKNFLQAHKEKSEYSWTRFMGTFIVTTAMVIALTSLLMGKEANVTLISLMLATAFGGKVLQKRTENGESIFTFTKNKKDNTEDDENTK
ncbi:hypothetical protein BPT24_119 [Tenacibaculum phage pT24]|uniref:Uncharacterized protein n=1 Tax=Tenacibaculum phage pT24 TaxID=1880590 RepID=A0A1B4XWS9_9CAUD|nr:hypothetical protein HYP10_gp119 [Tenacibaculum phage pT24]BAV39244.1 hypothetical protein BPT24_119 [Tenacibaculum phage pT24]